MIWSIVCDRSIERSSTQISSLRFQCQRSSVLWIRVSRVVGASAYRRKVGWRGARVPAPWRRAEKGIGRCSRTTNWHEKRKWSFMIVPLICGISKRIGCRIRWNPNTVEYGKEAEVVANFATPSSEAIVAPASPIAVTIRFEICALKYAHQ